MKTMTIIYNKHGYLLKTATTFGVLTATGFTRALTVPISTHPMCCSAPSSGSLQFNSIQFNSIYFRKVLEKGLFTLLCHYYTANMLGNSFT